MSPRGDPGHEDEKFGVRHGFEQKGAPQDACMDHRLRNDIWNVFYGHWPYDEDVRAGIWGDWAELTLDDFDWKERQNGHSPDHYGVLSTLKKTYWGIPESEHYKIYELVEAVCGGLEASRRRDFVADINSVLAENLSVYTLSKCRLERTMSDLEHGSVKKASKLSTKSRKHAEKAIKYMGATNPDYEASISESIKMVEHAAQKLGGKGKGLSSVVDSLSESLDLHPAMREQLRLTYRFANKTSRHSEPGEKYEPDSADAKAVLVWCATMANYLVDKAAAAGTDRTRSVTVGDRAGSPGRQARAQGRRSIPRSPDTGER